MSYCCILHVIQEGHYSFPIISEELVSLYGTHLTRGNLGCFEGSHWIGNEVNLISNLLYPISVHIFTIYWSIIYMGVYLYFFLSSNQVMDAYCRFLQHEDIGSTKLFISPYLAVSIKSQFVFFHDG